MLQKPQETFEKTGSQTDAAEEEVKSNPAAQLSPPTGLNGELQLRLFVAFANQYFFLFTCCFLNDVGVFKTCVAYFNFFIFPEAKQEHESDKNLPSCVPSEASTLKNEPRTSTVRPPRKFTKHLETAASKVMYPTFNRPVGRSLLSSGEQHGDGSELSGTKNIWM